MPDNLLETRKTLYFELSSRIAHMDTVQLRSLFASNETSSDWGTSHVLSIGSSCVFVKRVPVTDIEYDNQFSTRNLYDLPSYYNYGFGSAGLGVFRELVTHIKTTNWVLAGAISSFPLMFHYRIIPFDGPRAEPEMQQHNSYLEYWGGRPAIGRYLLDRANARYELVMFLEYFPHTVADWLLQNPHDLPAVIADVGAAITFLRHNGIIHLDTDFLNILTDGGQFYLTDFGLVLDQRFELSSSEQHFFQQNNEYDYGNLLWCLGSQLVWIYRALSNADKQFLSIKYGIPAGSKFEELLSILLNNCQDLASGSVMPLDQEYVASLARYRSVIEFMHEFYTSMRRNNKKDTLFDGATLHRLLLETGFVVETLPGVV